MKTEMSTTSELPDYSYRGARAVILLHEREMRRFLKVWHEAKAANVKLPKTDDPDYQSLEHVLHHVLRAARGYITWMCEKLQLPDCAISKAPAPDVVEAEAERYLDYLLNKWREPLAGIPEDRFYDTYKSRWGMDYSIDSMLEHALAHPMRHTFQLLELINR